MVIAKRHSNGTVLGPNQTRPERPELTTQLLALLTIPIMGIPTLIYFKHVGFHG